MVRCVAIGCPVQHSMGRIMHRFPRDPLRRQEWQEKVKRVDWQAHNNSFLCSDHFDASQYELERKDGVKRLKPYAVPTLFVFKPAPKSRKLPRKRTAECTAAKDPPPSKRALAEHTYSRARVESESSDIENKRPDVDGDTPAGDVETKAEDGDTPAGDVDTKAEDGDTPAGDVDTRAGDGDATAGDGDTKAGDGDATAGVGDTGGGDTCAGVGDPGDGDTKAGIGDPGDGDLSAGAGDTGDGDTTAGNGDIQAGSGGNSAGSSRFAAIRPRLTTPNTASAKDPLGDLREAAMTRTIRHLKQQLAKERKEKYKLKEENRRIARQVSVLSSKMSKVFNEDQLDRLSRPSSRGLKWSDETIKKGLQLRFACGPAGYDLLIQQHYPLPSQRSLRRSLQGSSVEQGMVEDLLQFVKKRANQTTTTTKPEDTVVLHIG